MTITNPKIRFAVTHLPHLILFLSSFVCFYFYLDYVFFYQEKSGLFLLSSDNFSAHLNRPGGLLMYFSEFLTAFYYYPLAGAFILASTISGSAFLTMKILQHYSGNDALFLPFVVGGVLFSFQAGYPVFLFNSLGVLLQLFAFYLVIKSEKLLKGWLPVVLFPLWYFATGSLALIFALQFTLHLLLKKESQRWVKLAAFWVLALVFLYFSEKFIFYFSLKELLVYPFQPALPDFSHRIFFTVIALLVLLPFSSFLKPKFLHERFFSGIIFRLAVPFLLITASVLIIFKQIDAKDRNYFRVEKLFYQGNYSGVIEYNRQHPSANILTNFLTNVALNESNQLTEKLFQFRQSPDGKTLFLPWKMETEVLKRGGYFYYSIGMINEAQRWAYENMVMKGLTPEGLKMLIKTELINGNYKMAEKYIWKLNQTLFYRKDARNFEKFLAGDAVVNSDPELGEKRKIKVRNDFFVLSDEPLLNLEGVLKTDSLNRKALEYKAASLLLKKDIKGLIKIIPLYQDFHSDYLPRYIEEAAVAYKMLQMGDATALENLKFRPATIDQFSSYIKTLGQFGNNKSAAQSDLFKRFGDTFWYYIFYR